MFVFRSRLAITQQPFSRPKTSPSSEATIIYNSGLLNKLQKYYLNYKYELYTLVKFIIKCEYLYKYPYMTAIIHTDPNH